MSLGSTPRYRQIAAELLNRMKSGALPSGSQLPGEFDLAAEFGVNRLTIRQAIAELKRVGAVVVHRGRGTYVATPPDLIEVVTTMRVPQPHGDAIRESIADDSNVRSTTEHVIRVTEAQERPIACEELGSSSLLRIDTTMERDGRTWILNSYFIDAAYEEVVEAISQYGFFATALQQRFSLDLAYAWRAFSAEGAQFEDATQFGVEPGTPVLVRDGLTKIADGPPLFYVRRRLLGEHAKFVLLYSEDS